MEHQHHFRGHGLLRRQKGAGEGPDAAEGFHPGDLRGATLDDGRLAEQNYVWLSDWQLENVNHNYQMPVDFESYKKLKNNIAKILAPLLQIWLYATRKKGVFEKRYDEICQLLDTAEYRHASKIREKIGPSLEELKEHGYLASWHIEKTSDGGGFKIILFHGEKFSRDLRRRLPAREAEASTRGDLSAASPKEPTAAATVEIDQGAIDEMGKRGIGETDARKFLAALGPGQPILDQLEYGDYQISRKRGKIANPPGFYIRCCSAMFRCRRALCPRARPSSSRRSYGGSGRRSRSDRPPRWRPRKPNGRGWTPKSPACRRKPGQRCLSRLRPSCWPAIPGWPCFSRPTRRGPSTTARCARGCAGCWPGVARMVRRVDEIYLAFSTVMVTGTVSLALAAPGASIWMVV